MKALAFFALALVGSTAVQAAPAGRFVKSGYIVEMDRTGSVLTLTGRNPKTKATFNLTVGKDNHVTGVFAGKPVDFVVGEKARVQTASISGQ